MCFLLEETKLSVENMGGLVLNYGGGVNASALVPRVMQGVWLVFGIL